MWLDLEGIMLSEISQTRKTTLYNSLYMELKKINDTYTKKSLQIHRTDWWLPEAVGGG